LAFYTLADSEMRNPYLALAIDEAACSFFAEDPSFHGFARMWQNPDAVCLGRTCDIQKNLLPGMLADLEAGRRPTLPVLRRASGGGTVLHGPGNWNYTMALSLEKFPSVFPVVKSYEIFLGIVRSALAKQGIDARMQGQSDLVQLETGRKISGNAQFRKRGICVHHGTLLVDGRFIQRIASQLPHPPKEPEYRKGRAHEDFLGSLPDTFSVSLFFQDLFMQAARFAGERAVPVPPHHRKKIFQLAGKLAKKIYTNRTWVLEGRIEPGPG
jgi:lipoate-protein ligase A